MTLNYSKRRLYLSLKRSLIDFFRAPVRLIKEGISPESIYEKPYQVDDYRSMHLNPSVPSWPTGEYSFGPLKSTKGGFEDVSTLTHTYVFEPPKCNMFPVECIEHDDTGLVDCYIVPTFAPAEAAGEYTWELIPDTDAVSIIEVQRLNRGMFAQFQIIPVDDSFEGLVTICATATYDGQIVRKLVFEKEQNEDVTNAQSGFFITKTPIKITLGKELAREYFADNIFECGCISFNVPCEPTECEDEKVENYSWDMAGSGYSVNRNNSVVIAVKDGNPPYLWSVEGQGFWFDSLYTLKSIETDTIFTTLYADGVACGSGNVTVQECYDRKVYASIQCPDSGHWVVCKSPVKCDIVEEYSEPPCVFHLNPPVGADNFYFGGLTVDIQEDGSTNTPYFCCLVADGYTCTCDKGGAVIPTTPDCMNIDFYDCGRHWQFNLASYDLGGEALCGGQSYALTNIPSEPPWIPSYAESYFEFRYWDCL